MKSFWISLWLLSWALALSGQNEQTSRASIWSDLTHHISISNGFGQNPYGDFTASIGVEYSTQLRMSPQVYAGLRTGFQLPEPGGGYALLPVQVSGKWLPEPTQNQPWYAYGSGGYSFGYFLGGIEAINSVQGGWGGELGIGRLWRIGSSSQLSTSLGYLRQRSRIAYLNSWWGDFSATTNTTTMSRLQWRIGLFF